MSVRASGGKGKESDGVTLLLIYATTYITRKKMRMRKKVRMRKEG